MLLDIVHWVQSRTAAVWRRAGRYAATALHRASLGAVGDGTQFQAGVRFWPPQAVSFGAHGYVWRGVDGSTELPGGYLRAGHRVQINADVHLDMTGGLVIGDDVLISEGAVIYTHDHGHDPRSVPVGYPKTIDRGAWIGMRAIILPGCRHVGAGAVIGAGAVVTRDVAVGAIMAGNPAREIGRKSFEVVA